MNSNNRTHERHYRLTYLADGSQFAIELFKNVILTLLTLGLYFPAAQVNVRKFIWGNMKFEKGIFQYLGTAFELYVGYFIALVFLFGLRLTFIFFNVILPDFIAGLTSVVIWCTVVPVAYYFSIDYKINRTAWDGQNFHLKGALKSNLLTMIKGQYLSILTLGLYWPFWLCQFYAIIVNQTKLGKISFRFSGDTKNVFVPYLFSLLFALPSFGLSLLWFHKNFANRLINHTTMIFEGQGEAKFRGDFEFYEFFAVFFIFPILGFFTFGLAAPWLITSSIRILTEKISATGNIDFTDFQKPHQSSISAVGEGLNTLGGIINP